MAREQKLRLEGTVVSDKMDKTVVVRVERVQRHPLYHKVLRVAKRYKAHDEGNEARVGDTVRIIESRPISRDKRWLVEEVVKRSAGVSPPAGEEVVP